MRYSAIVWFKFYQKKVNLILTLENVRKIVCIFDEKLVQFRTIYLILKYDIFTLTFLQRENFNKSREKSVAKILINDFRNVWIFIIIFPSLAWR